MVAKRVSFSSHFSNCYEVQLHSWFDLPISIFLFNFFSSYPFSIPMIDPLNHWHYEARSTYLYTLHKAHNTQTHTQIV